jgi:hypothetical protein
MSFPVKATITAGSFLTAVIDEAAAVLCNITVGEDDGEIALVCAAGGSWFLGAS